MDHGRGSWRIKNLVLFIGEVRRGAKDCCVRFSLSLSLFSFCLYVCGGAQHFLLLIQNEQKREMKRNFIQIIQNGATAASKQIKGKQKHRVNPKPSFLPFNLQLHTFVTCPGTTISVLSVCPYVCSMTKGIEGADRYFSHLN